MLVRRTIKRLKSSKKNHQLEIENLVKNIHYYKAEVNQSEVEILKNLKSGKNKNFNFLILHLT